MLASLLKAIGIYKPTQELYYKFFRSVATMEINGFERTFYSGRPDLYRRIINAGGERPQLEKFIDLVNSGDVVWDIGGFIGMFTLFASAKVGETGHVVTFEPEPATFALLQDNCRRNDAKNVTLLNAALSDSTDQGQIFAAKDDENAIHSLRPSDHLRSDGIPTQLYRADELVEQGKVRAPNAVKIDVEGAECLVLDGMKNLISSDDCRLLFIEVHPHDLSAFGQTVADVDERIKAAGFNISEKTERGTEYHYFCTKP